MNANANRMNEVMKALAIMASLFMPITFLAGLYGMNFENIPELGWKYFYPVFPGVCVVTTISLLVYFTGKGWIGKWTACATETQETDQRSSSLVTLTSKISA